MSGTPSITQFDPHAIPWQYDLIRDVRNFDYSQGFLDALLSGTLGSAKSMAGIHLGVTHCLMFPGAQLGLARRAMPDLKDTVFAKMIEHIAPDLEEGVDYEVNETRAQIHFSNGSKVIGRSWGDQRSKKSRSLDLSALLIEELTENESEEDIASIEELKNRIGRVPGIPESWCISMTNPDSPAHWAFKYYFNSKNTNRRVYLSSLDQNPFLPAWYKESLLKNLDPKMAERMVKGKWIEIRGEVVYYAYDPAVNYIKKPYKIDPRYPIRISFDFNIGEKKPLSAVFFQFINDEFHFFDECVIHSAITEEACEDMIERGLLDHPTKYLVHGDATGKAKSTQAKYSNYDQIFQKFRAHRVERNGEQVPVDFEMQVLKSNPPIRKRHATVNGYFKNALKEHRAWVYEACSTADEGFRLTKLKKGGQYAEDDSKPYQHITTAAGYGIITTLMFNESKPQGTVVL